MFCEETLNNLNALFCFILTDNIIVVLAADEEFALDYNLDDLRDYHKLYWETEFKPVAQKLLQRIQNCNF